MAFLAGDVATIQDMLHDYLWESISVRDTAVRRNMKENFYHGMLLGLLQSQDSWLVQSNAEMGKGLYISEELTIPHGQSDHLSRRFRSLISERDSR